MFCTKCGFDAGNAKFCPRCGTPVEMEPGAQMSQAGEARPQEKTGVPSAGNEQPQRDTYYGNDAGEQLHESGIQGMQAPENGAKSAGRKKKWPKVLAVIAAVAVVLGIGLYFAFPLIAEAVSPKKQAVAALKNAGGSFESLVSNAFSASSSGSSVSTKQQMKGAYKLENMEIDGENYLSNFKVDTVNYDIQLDSVNSLYSGTITLSSGSAAPVLSIKFYNDGSDVYFQIPELLTESFKVTVNLAGAGQAGNYYNVLSTLASGMDSASLEQYSAVIEAVVKDCVKGFNTMVDHCVYKKNGKQTLEADGLSAKTTSYDVTLTAKALSKGLNAAVDAMYDDKELSTYMTMISTFTGYSKDKIKAGIDTALAGMQDITFTMYVKDERIAALEMELAQFDNSTDGKISFKFLGEKVSDYFLMEVTESENSAVIKYDGTKNNKIVSCEMKQKSAYQNEYFRLYLDMETSGKELVMNECSLKAELDDARMDFKISGKGAISDFSKMTLSPSDFANALNMEYLTTQQEEELYLELAENIEVFEKLFSDSFINSLTDRYSTSGY